MRKIAIIAGIFVAVALFTINNSPIQAAKQEDKSKKVVVTVQSGDSLSSIAQKHKTTYQRIFFANKSVQNPDVINPGQKLRIPSKKEKLKERPLASTVVIPAAVSYAYKPQASASAGVPAQSAAKASGDVWDKIAACESGGNWQINTGNGYYGGVQFSPGSWAGVGGKGMPHQASKAEQIKRAQMLQARQGWGAWPACSAKLGLR